MRRAMLLLSIMTTTTKTTAPAGAFWCAGSKAA
jgi:hypothetical protein